MRASRRMGDTWAMVRDGADAPPHHEGRPYRPIASAIRPSVPTITRHQANTVKPWRVT